MSDRPLAIDLPHGVQTIIDEGDWLIVKPLTLYRGTNGYVYYSEWRFGRSRPHTLHGLLMGDRPGMHIDHINGDKLDNRRCNLRIVTPAQNQINRKKLNRNNSSGVRGVAFRPTVSPAKPWHAQIMASGRCHSLGRYATQEEAVAARRVGELAYFGELCP